jgi:hypothetical protein
MSDGTLAACRPPRVSLATMHVPTDDENVTGSGHCTLVIGT